LGADDSDVGGTDFYGPVGRISLRDDNLFSSEFPEISSKLPIVCPSLNVGIIEEIIIQRCVLAQNLAKSAVWRLIKSEQLDELRSVKSHYRLTVN
jgi:hypothetical protein